MTNAGRKATAVLVAALVMMEVGRAKAHDEPIVAIGRGELTIVLHVVNSAALTRDVLNRASARVARVYEVIGVHTVWVDGGVTVEQRRDGRLHLTVMLLSRDIAQKKISAEGATGRRRIERSEVSFIRTYIALGCFARSGRALSDISPRSG